MALSNPYRGERRPGAVGIPLPGVEVRLRAESGAAVAAEDEPGEIQVPFTARECFPHLLESSRRERGVAFEDGWFKTGDMAVLERGYYRIMGRLSVDIIKSGGYKLLRVGDQSALLEHPDIGECIVIGLPDATWGEAVYCCRGPGTTRLRFSNSPRCGLGARADFRPTRSRSVCNLAKELTVGCHGQGLEASRAGIVRDMNLPSGKRTRTS